MGNICIQNSQNVLAPEDISTVVRPPPVLKTKAKTKVKAPTFKRYLKRHGGWEKLMVAIERGDIQKSKIVALFYESCIGYTRRFHLDVMFEKHGWSAFEHGLISRHSDELQKLIHIFFSRWLIPQTWEKYKDGLKKHVISNETYDLIEHEAQLLSKSFFIEKKAIEERFDNPDLDKLCVLVAKKESATEQMRTESADRIKDARDLVARVKCDEALARRGREYHYNSRFKRNISNTSGGQRYIENRDMNAFNVNRLRGIQQNQDNLNKITVELSGVQGDLYAMLAKEDIRVERIRDSIDAKYDAGVEQILSQSVNCQAMDADTNFVEHKSQMVLDMTAEILVFRRTWVRTLRKISVQHYDTYCNPPSYVSPPSYESSCESSSDLCETSDSAKSE